MLYSCVSCQYYVISVRLKFYVGSGVVRALMKLIWQSVLVILIDRYLVERANAE